MLAEVWGKFTSRGVRKDAGLTGYFIGLSVEVGYGDEEAGDRIDAVENVVLELDHKDSPLALMESRFEADCLKPGSTAKTGEIIENDSVGKELFPDFVDRAEVLAVLVYEFERG